MVFRYLFVKYRKTISIASHTPSSLLDKRVNLLGIHGFDGNLKFVLVIRYSLFWRQFKVLVVDGWTAEEDKIVKSLILTSAAYFFTIVVFGF